MKIKKAVEAEVRMVSLAKLAEALRSLHGLQEEGIVTKEEYTSLKERILRCIADVVEGGVEEQSTPFLGSDNNEAYARIPADLPKQPIVGVFPNQKEKASVVEVASVVIKRMPSVGGKEHDEHDEELAFAFEGGFEDPRKATEQGKENVGSIRADAPLVSEGVRPFEGKEVASSKGNAALFPSGASFVRREAVGEVALEEARARSVGDIAFMQARAVGEAVLEEARSFGLTGEIARLFEGEPSAALWGEMCVLFRSQKGLDWEALNVRLDQRWPDRLRQAPVAWVEELLRGERGSWWSCVRALDIGEERLGRSLKMVELQMLTRFSELAGVRSVQLSKQKMGAQGARFLVDSTWSDLRRLEIGGCALGPEGLAILLKGNWPKLEVLSLWSNLLGDSGVRLLCEAPWSSLRALDLSGNAVTALGIERFVQAGWPVLERLRLAWNKLASAGVHALARRSWESLKVLDLGFNWMHDEGVVALSKGHLPALEVLDLTDNGVGFLGANTLAQSPWPNLRALYLMRNSIAADGGKSLARATWPLLQRLDLRRNRLGDAGVIGLCSANWPTLQHLDLAGNDFGAEGARALAYASFPILRTLLLGFNWIGDDGVKVLAKANWPALEVISLERNHLSDASVRWLQEVPWPCLREINLSMNPLTPEGLAALEKSLSARLQQEKR